MRGIHAAHCNSKYDMARSNCGSPCNARSEILPFPRRLATRMKAQADTSVPYYATSRFLSQSLTLSLSHLQGLFPVFLPSFSLSLTLFLLAHGKNATSIRYLNRRLARYISDASERNIEWPRERIKRLRPERTAWEIWDLKYGIEANATLNKPWCRVQCIVKLTTWPDRP